MTMDVLYTLGFPFLREFVKSIVFFAVPGIEFRTWVHLDRAVEVKNPRNKAMGIAAPETKR
jgi:hypothetical protein